MTPRQLLESVKARFVVLLHDEPEKLDALLVQAIGEYQDRAGAIRSLTITEDEQRAGGIAIPPHFLQLVGAQDQDGDYHEVEVVGDKINIPFVQRYSRPPYKADYLLNLKGYDLDNDNLPNASIGPIQNYLYTLIDLPNTGRVRQVNTASGLPVDHLQGEAEILQTKQQLEQEMEESGAMLMPYLIL